ncbi:MAG: Zn-dependent oligopeptidase [Halioglobus sp.]|nr:Zn-dependent oligopeptidase [Halioglobus sp.]
MTAIRLAVPVAIWMWFTLGTAVAADSSHSSARDGWDYTLTGAGLTALCDSTLATAREAFGRLEQDTQAATLQRVYGAYDAILTDLQPIQHIWYMKAVHPSPGVQTAAERCISQYTDFIVAMNLSPAFYQRVAAIDLSEASDQERYMVDRKLRLFRQSGVDRDAATRKQVRALVTDITDLGSRFEKAIRLDKRYVQVTPAQLAGLPRDFVDAHPVDEQGLVTISTDYPDYLPVMKYASSDELRHRLFKAAKSIATPSNTETLERLLSRRHELAVLLGYDSHAALAMDGLMTARPQTVQQFLAALDSALQSPANSDVDTLLSRLQRVDPQAQQVQAWQVDWLTNLVQQEEYALDAREIRNYFHFDRVQSGIFALTEDLFGVRIVPWQTPTWHPDVTAWEIREQGRAIGRFYLDMHPRDNKYGHAAHWTLRAGLKDRQIPLSGMATNFPRGLMEHKQVESFLHEFGHLLHNMFSGTQRWLDIAGMTMERDFVEAPSQLLEQWAWHYETLRELAINDQGQRISPALVETMNAAQHFGEAANTRTQVFYANLALHYHNRDPGSFELLPLMRELQAQHSPYPYVQGTHFYNNFRHLNGYSSNYYIYQWSQAISMDLFSRFQRHGLRDKGTARDYREQILAAAGSKPAADMVEAFLGRPFSPATYTRHLGRLQRGRATPVSAQ